MLLYLESVRCNFRWLNFPGSPPAIVKAKITRQHFLFHLRCDLQSHFRRIPALNHLCTPCPFCGSTANSNVHRVFDCALGSHNISTQDVLSCRAQRRALCAFRNCYTSLLPCDDDHQEFPRSYSDYLFWLSCSAMLVVDPERHVRALNDGEMQLLADASHGLHLLYTKYSLLMAPDSASLPTTSGRNTLNPSSCSLSWHHAHRHVDVTHEGGVLLICLSLFFSSRSTAPLISPHSRNCDGSWNCIPPASKDLHVASRRKPLKCPCARGLDCL
jgi:hypothetical protein